MKDCHATFFGGLVRPRRIDITLSDFAIIDTPTWELVRVVGVEPTTNGDWLPVSAILQLLNSTVELHTHIIVSLPQLTSSESL